MSDEHAKHTRSIKTEHAARNVARNKRVIQAVKDEIGRMRREPKPAIKRWTLYD